MPLPDLTQPRASCWRAWPGAGAVYSLNSFRVLRRTKARSASGSLGMLSLKSSKEFCSWLEEKEAAWGRRAWWEGSTSQAWEDAARSLPSAGPRVSGRVTWCLPFCLRCLPSPPVLVLGRIGGETPGLQCHRERHWAREADGEDRASCAAGGAQGRDPSPTARAGGRRPPGESGLRSGR